MRRSLLLFFLLVSTISFAQARTVHVTDPAGAPVAGARIEFFAGSIDSFRLSESVVSDRNGDARIRSTGMGYIRVLAAGFAPASERLVFRDSRDRIPVQLEVASATETVTVTAAETPLTSAESATSTETLDRETLVNRQPVTAAEAIRFLPGAIINESGRRGGLASLFVRGGDSRYNKVLVDGVPIDEPGGAFDFGVVPNADFDRYEFVRGAESVLYGSDAMTSVVQAFTAPGATRTPELILGAEGGTFSTARGYADLAGAYRRFDYRFFGEQFNTQGQGVNDDFSNSSEGANVGIALASRVGIRLRARHSNNRTGVQSFWNFNGQPLITPDSDQFARQNNFIGSAELTIDAPERWHHSLEGFEYNHRRTNVDSFMDPGRTTPLFGNFDFPFSDFANLNRAGLEYRGEYSARSWSRTLFGYEFEDENGFVGDLTALPLTHALRRNHGLYGEQVFTFSRGSLLLGGRYVHNESFGDRGIPRAAGSLVLWRGNPVLSGTRLHASYGEGIKEPRLEESFGQGGFGIVPNPNLRPEKSRSLEAGFIQSFFATRASFSATYYNNLFRDQIEFTFDPTTFAGQYVNLNKALAHGAELEFHARPASKLDVVASYTYTSTQILEAPTASDPLLAQGAPLLRRPKHAASLGVNYYTQRWGANLSGVALGRRTDSDFLGLQPPVNHAAGYARFDLGGWRELNHHVTATLNVENLFNRRYEEAAGFPALGINARAGLRFRFGGD